MSNTGALPPASNWTTDVAIEHQVSSTRLGNTAVATALPNTSLRPGQRRESRRDGVRCRSPGGDFGFPAAATSDDVTSSPDLLDDNGTTCGVRSEAMAWKLRCCRGSRSYLTTGRPGSPTAVSMPATHDCCGLRMRESPSGLHPGSEHPAAHVHAAPVCATRSRTTPATRM